MTRPAPREVFVTGKRWTDLLVFGAFVIFMLATSFRLRVYYRAPAARVEAPRAQ